jgi:hypothetical protein
MKNSTPSKMPSMLHPSFASPKNAMCTSKSAPKNKPTEIEPKMSTAAVNEPIQKCSAQKPATMQESCAPVVMSAPPAMPSQPITQEIVQVKIDIPEPKKEEMPVCTVSMVEVKKEEPVKVETMENVAPPKEEKHEEKPTQIVCETKKQDDVPTEMVTETEKKPVEKCEPMKEITQPKMADEPQENAQHTVNEMVKPQAAPKVACSNGKRKAYMVCPEYNAKKIRVEKENTLIAQKPKTAKNDYSHVRPKIDTNLKAAKKNC